MNTNPNQTSLGRRQKRINATCFLRAKWNAHMLFICCMRGLPRVSRAACLLHEVLHKFHSRNLCMRYSTDTSAFRVHRRGSNAPTSPFKLAAPPNREAWPLRARRPKPPNKDVFAAAAVPTARAVAGNSGPSLVGEALSSTMSASVKVRRVRCMCASVCLCE